jgi:hypothetical protein
MVRRTSTVRRRGLTAYKLFELLTGKIMKHGCLALRAN